MKTSLPNTMVALKKLHDEPGLWFVDGVPLPNIGPKDVLVAVTNAGICGTDRHIFEWDAWSKSRVPLGITTGHEFVGRVVDAGPAVSRVAVGQRVSAEGHITCGVCELCRTGQAHICESVEILGVDTNGCFAQYVAVPEENIWPLEASVPDAIAAIYDPLGNAMHTAMAAGVSGRSVLITGAGIIGLMAVGIAKANGASRVFVTDVDPRRLELAKELGAVEAFDARDPNWKSEIRSATRGLGPEVLLEMSGHPTAINDGLNVLRGGGTAAMLGIPAGNLEIDLTRDIIFKGLQVLGINGRRMFTTWYQVEDFVLNHRDLIEPIITHQTDMCDFEESFAMMQRGEAIKVVLNIPQESSFPCPTPNSTHAAKSC